VYNRLFISFFVSQKYYYFKTNFVKVQNFDKVVVFNFMLLLYLQGFCDMLQKADFDVTKSGDFAERVNKPFIA
jgi:hypothetical protein